MTDTDSIVQTPSSVERYLVIITIHDIFNLNKRHCNICHYTVSPKKVHLFIFQITLSKVNRF